MKAKTRSVTIILSTSRAIFTLAASFISSMAWFSASRNVKANGSGFEVSKENSILDSIEIHSDAISADDVVLIHDDLLATGGSMKAAYDLVSLFHPREIFINFIIELRMEGLKGREALGADKNISTLLTLHE